MTLGVKPRTDTYLDPSLKFRACVGVEFLVPAVIVPMVSKKCRPLESVEAKFRKRSWLSWVGGGSSCPSWTEPTHTRENPAAPGRLVLQTGTEALHTASSRSISRLDSNTRAPANGQSVAADEIAAFYSREQVKKSEVRKSSSSERRHAHWFRWRDEHGEHDDHDEP